jgi:hypothetical protein
MNARKLPEPTAEELEHGRLVANEAIEIFNRLMREGMAPNVILSGLANAAADAITSLYGPDCVAPWFDGMAATARSMREGS